DLRQVGYATARCAVGEVPKIWATRIADQIGVPNDCTAIAATCPIMASLILPSRKGSSFMLTAGEHVMLVRCITTTVDEVSLLGESRCFVDLIVVAMQVVE